MFKKNLVTGILGLVMLLSGGQVFGQESQYPSSCVPLAAYTCSIDMEGGAGIDFVVGAGLTFEGGEGILSCTNPYISGEPVRKRVGFVDFGMSVGFHLAVDWGTRYRIAGISVCRNPFEAILDGNGPGIDAVGSLGLEIKGDFFFFGGELGVSGVASGYGMGGQVHVGYGPSVGVGFSKGWSGKVIFLIGDVEEEFRQGVIE